MKGLLKKMKWLMTPPPKKKEKKEGRKGEEGGRESKYKAVLTDWQESVHKKPEQQIFHMKDQTLFCSRGGLRRVLPAFGGEATSRTAPSCPQCRRKDGSTRGLAPPALCPWWPYQIRIPYAIITQIHPIICFYTSFLL